METGEPYDPAHMFKVLLELLSCVNSYGLTRSTAMPHEGTMVMQVTDAITFHWGGRHEWIWRK